MASGSDSRPYRKVARARREEETRLRITEAAVELHETLGPARTTIADVARKAGVSRTTVYGHFSTETELFSACSTHWATLNPFPDPSRWARVEDPAARLPQALDELYLWYGAHEGMMGKVFRDMAVVDALGEVMDGLWSPYVERLVDTLAAGWRVPPAEVPTLRAGLRLGLDFATWRSLTEAGLDDHEAAGLVTRMIRAVFPPGGSA